MLLSYIAPEDWNVTDPRIIFLGVRRDPGAVVEDKYACKEDLKQVLHHGHEVEETGASEIMKNKREILIKICAT